MEALILNHEPAIRLGCFLGAFALIAVGELLAPRRAPTLTRAMRWPANLGLTALNTLLVRLLFPLAAVGAAAFAAARGWGLLNYLEVPLVLELPVALLALDLLIYLQHVMMHAVPALWRLHRVHHADLDYDLTTGVRFHPLEILLSMVVKCAAILALGPPAVAVLVFEVLLNTSSLFNHGNLRLPAGVDRALRWLLVTPDMHRVHHSVAADEANSNFGFNLPWWDHLLGTYRDQPRAGHLDMTVGIAGHADPAQVARLWPLLRLPLAGKITDYAINRRGDDRR